MSAAWDARALLEPIAGEQPCGQNLDDTGVLASLRRAPAVRAGPLPRGAAGPEDDQDKEAAKAKPPHRVGPDSGRRARRRSAEEQGSSPARVPGDGAAADRRPAGLFRDAARRRRSGSRSSGRSVYPLVDEDADRAAERAELLCGSDGGGRSHPAGAARREPAARHVQPARHRDRAQASVRRAARGASRTRPQIQAAFTAMPLRTCGSCSTAWSTPSRR